MNTQAKIIEYRERAKECYAQCATSAHPAFWETMGAKWEHMAEVLEIIVAQRTRRAA